VPLLRVQVVKQLLMDEATIGKQRDHLICRQDGMQLIEDGVVGFKTDLCTPVAHGSPRQRNSPTAIQERGTDQHKRREGRRIECDIETLIHRPVNQSGLHHRCIPLRW
jgi:hypothetical protein